MNDMANVEKIGIKKIKLMKPEQGGVAIVGSFANADNFLMEWCDASKGWLRCYFEIEYLDEHILKGEYKTFRRKNGRVSLSQHIRTTLWKALKRMDTLSNSSPTFNDIKIQFWAGACNSEIETDFLDRYEIDDCSSR